MEHTVTKKRNFIGVVVSDKMMKTVVVEVVHTRRHSRYLKAYLVTNRFKCHNENNEAKTGDQVEVEETRPMSKDKRWRISKILKLATAGTKETQETTS